jgi:hypothetical protein
MTGSSFQLGDFMIRLISDAYRELNCELHRSEPGYGTSAYRKAPFIAQIIAPLSPSSLLDYGCGKGTLKPALQEICPTLDIREYDPAVPGKDARARRLPTLLCLDVMEHIEPDALPLVISDIRRITLKRFIMEVALRPAKKILADGRNAHLIVQPADWWLSQFATHFAVEAVAAEDPNSFSAAMAPRS